MNAMTFESLPKAVAELNRKVDLLMNRLSDSQKESEDDDIVLIDEAAEIISKTKATIYAMTHRNEIKHFKRGNRLYFSKKDLREYIKAGRVKTIEEIQSDAVENLKRK